MAFSQVRSSSSEEGRSLASAGESEMAAGPFPQRAACLSTFACSQEACEAEAVAFEEAKKSKGLGFASPRAGALIIANTLLGGSGMLGIPHALSVSGYLLGVCFMIIFGAASAFGCHLLHCSARKIGVAPCSFYSVSNAVAPRWTWLIDGAVMVKCFGVATSYIIIVGDLAPPALHYIGLTKLLRWEAVTVGFLPAAALACLQHLSALKYTAVCSMVIVAWTCILIVCFSLRLEGFDPCPGESKQDHLPCDGAEFKPVVYSDLLVLGKALPIFIFGFTCQQNVFTVCNEVRQATRPRVDRIILAAYIFAGAAFTSAAVLGYLTYGDRVQSNVLKGYPDNLVTQLTRLLYSLLAIFSFPLQIHPSRNSALALWNLASPLDNSRGQEVDMTSFAVRQTESTRYLAITTLELALAFFISLQVRDLGLVLGVVGATGSTMVSYILPGIVYTQAFPEWHLKRVLAYCQLAAGCIIMPFCLILVFMGSSGH